MAAPKSSRASLMAKSVKNLSVSVGDLRDSGLTPGSGRFCGGGNGTPLQNSCLGNPMDRGAGRLQSMGSQELDMT